MTPAQILAGLILERWKAGLWVQGYEDVPARYVGLRPSPNFVDNAMACCALGAIKRDAAALVDPKQRQEAIRQLQDAMDWEANLLGFACIENYNDAPTTKRHHMIALLERASARLGEASP